MTVQNSHSTHLKLDFLNKVCYSVSCGEPKARCKSKFNNLVESQVY